MSNKNRARGRRPGTLSSFRHSVISLKRWNYELPALTYSLACAFACSLGCAEVFRRPAPDELSVASFAVPGDAILRGVLVQDDLGRL